MAGETTFSTQEYFSMRFTALEDFIDERDRRYEERFKAQELASAAALAAAKERVALAAEATEKAIIKAEASQTSYNQQHNDLQRKMENQYGMMIPRIEHENDIRVLDIRYNDLKTELQVRADELKTDLQKKYDDLRAEVQGLRESRSVVAGNTARGATELARQQWLIVLLVSIGTFALGVLLRGLP